MLLFTSRGQQPASTSDPMTSPLNTVDEEGNVFGPPQQHLPVSPSHHNYMRTAKANSPVTFVFGPEPDSPDSASGGLSFPRAVSGPPHSGLSSPRADGGGLPAVVMWPEASAQFDAPPEEFPLRRTYSDSNIKRSRSRGGSRRKHRARHRSVDQQFAGSPSVQRHGSKSCDTSPGLRRRNSLGRARKQTWPYAPSASTPTTPTQSHPSSPSGEGRPQDTTAILADAARLVAVAQQRAAGKNAAKNPLPTGIVVANDESDSSILKAFAGTNCSAVAPAPFATKALLELNPELYSRLQQLPEAAAPALEMFRKCSGASTQLCSEVLTSKCKNGVVLISPVLRQLAWPASDPILAVLTKMRQLQSIRVLHVCIGNGPALESRANPIAEPTFFTVNLSFDHPPPRASHPACIDIDLSAQDAPVTDSDLLACIRSLVVPLGASFSPSLVICSTDFFCDAAAGAMKISNIGFATAVQCLMTLGNGNTILASPTPAAIPEQALCLEACIKALLGDELPCMPFPSVSPLPATAASLAQVAARLADNGWPVLKTTGHYVALSPAEFSETGGRSSDDDTILATAALASLSMMAS